MQQDEDDEARPGNHQEDQQYYKQRVHIILHVRLLRLLASYELYVKLVNQPIIDQHFTNYLANSLLAGFDQLYERLLLQCCASNEAAVDIGLSDEQAYISGVHGAAV